MDSHTKYYELPDPGVPIQILYICINRAVRPLTQTVSLGAACDQYKKPAALTQDLCRIKSSITRRDGAVTVSLRFDSS